MPASQLTTDERYQITDGTGSGQTREIASNTATAITTTANWATNPDDTSVYMITGAGDFTVTLGARLELNTPLAATMTEIDRYVVVNNSRYWDNFGFEPSAVTVLEILLELNQAGYAKAIANDITTDNMEIRSKIWGKTGSTDDAISVLKEGVGVTDADIIGIPVVMMWNSGAATPNAISHQPDFVNLLYVNGGAGGQTVSVPPASFGPYDAAGNDVYKQFLDAAIPGDVSYADNWYLFHIKIGEVHCGSNTTRKIPPDTSWWDE